MYPGLVYGFVHFLRGTDAMDPRLSPNDILLSENGEALPSIKDYARILEGLTGRMLVRNDYSRYESIALAILKANVVEGESPLFRGFPDSTSPLSLDAFFTTLYRAYDLRFAYAYTDPGVKHLRRVMWDEGSTALVSLQDENLVKGSIGYFPRVSST